MHPPHPPTPPTCLALHPLQVYMEGFPTADAAAAEVPRLLRCFPSSNTVVLHMDAGESRAGGHGRRGGGQGTWTQVRAWAGDRGVRQGRGHGSSVGGGGEAGKGGVSAIC